MQDPQETGDSSRFPRVCDPLTLRLWWAGSQGGLQGGGGIWPGLEGCGHHSRRKGLPGLGARVNSVSGAAPGSAPLWAFHIASRFPRWGLRVWGGHPAQGGRVGSVLGGKAAVSCPVLLPPGLCGPCEWPGARTVCPSFTDEEPPGVCGGGEWTPSQHSHQLTRPSLASVFPISKVGPG